MSAGNQITQDTGMEACKGCKQTAEHMTTIFPFQILEKMADKPLRIRGVAMTAGVLNKKSRVISILFSIKLKLDKTGRRSCRVASFSSALKSSLWVYCKSNLVTFCYEKLPGF
jgi:hypothetical protein